MRTQGAPGNEHHTVVHIRRGSDLLSLREKPYRATSPREETRLTCRRCSRILRGNKEMEERRGNNYLIDKWGHMKR